MLDSLITSRTRIKILLKFFLNTAATSYLRNLEEEFGESTNAIRVELNRLEEAGLLQSESVSNKKVYRANTKHPLFPEIHAIIRKYIGIDKIIDEVLSKLGQVKAVYLVGELARGLNADEVKLLIIAKQIDIAYLEHLVQKASAMISRKITYKLMTEEDAAKELSEYKDNLLIFSMDV
ncbi:MAG: winged helix-turn-helix domain-containing protein [Bacteroidales bacterium]